MPNGDVVQGNKNELSGDFRGSQNFFDSTVNMAWSPPPPYDPPAPPAPDDLPDPGPCRPAPTCPTPATSALPGGGSSYWN